MANWKKTVMPIGDIALSKYRVVVYLSNWYISEIKEEGKCHSGLTSTGQSDCRSLTTIRSDIRWSYFKSIISSYCGMIFNHSTSILSQISWKKLWDLQEQAEHLGKLVTGGDFPHLLVYGPPGAGKKTRVIPFSLQSSINKLPLWLQVMCLLREMYGAGVERLRLEHQTFTTPSKKKVGRHPF